MPNPYLLKHFPWLTPEEELLLEDQIRRRAAGLYEQAGLPREAAVCWAEAGEWERASRLYLQAGDLRQAALILLDGEQYTDALSLYLIWEAELPSADLAGQVEALLGQAACHLLGVEQPGGVGGVLDGATGRAAYRRARRLLEEVHPWPPPAGMREGLSRAWGVLGAYGERIGRFDLMLMGNERALAWWGTSEGRGRLLRAFLRGARSFDDRLLSARIEQQLAELEAQPPRPAWHAEREAIEAAGFREKVHDVLHFTNQAQREVWERLAGLEDQPEVDAYLRTLAPEGMIYIPPGAFLMGSPDDDAEADADEKPQHEFRLAGYYIDRCPVTNAQYRRFIEAGGYGRAEYWGEAQAAGRWANGMYNDYFSGARAQPGYWENANYNGDQQPVVGVSWWEALAYARWAGKMLPSEAHWEKAAAWDAAAKRRRKYPWGDVWDEKAADWGHKREGALPVGSLPAGASASGVLDMVGGVWEWCSTRSRNEQGKDYTYPYQPEDGREQLAGGDNVVRVVRGASWWHDDPRVMRCGCRRGLYPRSGDDNWGFRCITPHAFSPLHAES